MASFNWKWVEVVDTTEKILPEMTYELSMEIRRKKSLTLHELACLIGLIWNTMPALGGGGGRNTQAIS